MNPIRVVLRDDSLPHQIRLFFHRERGGKTFVAVSCNCRQIGKYHNAYVPMGPAPNLEAAWALYDDPSNHNHSRDRFYGRGSEVAAEAEADD